MLEGTDLYKRFTQRHFLKQKPFDPLNAREVPPEACGYGIRNLRLSATLLQIEVRHPMKPGVDSSLLVDHVLAPLVPPATMAILKHQKRLLSAEMSLDDLPTSISTMRGEREYAEMRESGFINVNSEVFQERCRTCGLYPFSIALQQGGRVELIARSYSAFKAWVYGLNALVKFRKQLPRLRQKIETYTTVT